MADYICPNCKMVTYDEEALLCHFCGESLQKSGQGFLGRIKYDNKKIIWYFTIFLILLSLILLAIK